MKLLIIGGTRFLGRALVEAALAANHEVTLFNRGQSNPALFGELEQLQGDRDGGLDVLQGRTWDAVIDTCGYIPRLVRDSATLLADQVNHYTFISTISVYADFNTLNMDEDGPLGTIEDETVEEVTAETYGPLKVLCENAATEAMNGRCLNVRAGLIVGPHDVSDRFTYWPHRINQGGEILAPGLPQTSTQFIDVRDIAAWTVAATAAGLTGPYNVTGPNTPLTMQELFTTCQQVTQTAGSLTWVSDEFLQQHEVGSYLEMPLWIPVAEGAGFSTINCRKAIAAGLTTRSLIETIQDTLAWSSTRPDTHEWRAGLTTKRETELLQAWHQ